MNAVNRFFIVAFAFVTSFSFSQSTSEKLKREQDRLEQKINDTKLLLSKSQTNTASSLNELKVIENQITFREQLLKNYDNQIRGAELNVQKKSAQISELSEKITELKKQYKLLLIYAYKHRNKYGQLMYIFSSDNYYEAIKRNEYLERVSEMQQKQFLIIRQHQKMIKQEIESIEKERTFKMALLNEKKVEKEQISQDKVRQEKVYQKFKKEEEKLYAQLKEDERKKEVLKAQISAAIQKEIAEAEAKRRKAEEEARKKSNSASTTGTSTASTSKTIEFSETKESIALGKSFESNKGKLPWPVEKGSITEGFGKNPHPTLANVVTNNNGIDISTSKNSQVRAVFEGEVTSVLNIPGAGKVVIIKHGSYRTVYSNLQDTYVKSGSKVSTKQAIGSALVKEGSAVSVVHFEIHQVVGTAVQCLNPSLWVAN